MTRRHGVRARRPTHRPREVYVQFVDVRRITSSRGVAAARVPRHLTRVASLRGATLAHASSFDMSSRGVAVARAASSWAWPCHAWGALSVSRGRSERGHVRRVGHAGAHWECWGGVRCAGVRRVGTLSIGALGVLGARWECWGRVGSAGVPRVGTLSVYGASGVLGARWGCSRAAREHAGRVARGHVPRVGCAGGTPGVLSMSRVGVFAVGVPLWAH